MSLLVITEELFLGKEELNRLTRFLSTDGYRSYFSRMTAQYGLLPVQDNFSVGIDDFASRTLRVSAGYAFDSSANLITGELTNGIQIPATDVWYWLKVKYAENKLEVGTVNVSASGAVVGVGTKFTEVLRGQAFNTASLIRFFSPNGNFAPLNGTIEYEVSSVDSDTEITLASFAPTFDEANLKYAVVGTFTPSHEIQPEQEYIYRYDSVSFTLVAETTLNEQPAFGVGENENNTFWLARVKKTASDFFVHDKRSRFWKSLDSVKITDMDNILNYVVGVEAVKFEGANAPRANNNVYVAWGLKSNNFTFIPENRQLTLSTASGGCVQNIAQISAFNRDFSGWRVYKDSDGVFSNTYCKIVSSSYPTSNTLRLTLEVADPNFFAGVSDTVYVVPNVEEISIRAKPVLLQDVGETTFTFPIRQQSAVLNLLVNDETYTYALEYRYKNHFEYGSFVKFPSDAEVGYTTGYYDEFQFGVDGLPILTPTLSDYFDGEITLNRSPLAYSIVIGSLSTGEIRGVNRTSVSNAVPFRDIVVGTDKQYQIFENPSVILSAVNYINVKTTDVNNDPVKEGSVFYLIFKQSISKNTFDIRIKQDALISNPNGTGTLIRQFTDLDYASSIAEDGLIIKLVFDGTNWDYQRYTDFTSIPDTITVTDYDNNWTGTSSFAIPLSYRIEFDGWVTIFGGVTIIPNQSVITEKIANTDDIPFGALDVGILPLAQRSFVTPNTATALEFYMFRAGTKIDIYVKTFGGSIDDEISAYLYGRYPIK